MKVFAALISILALFTVAGYFILKLTSPGFPIDRVITNSEGKALEVILVGKTGDKLHFDRKSDQQRFEIPGHKLSASDRLFMMRLPQEKPPEVAVVKEAPPEPNYVQNRLNVIEDLEKKRAIIRRELDSNTLNPLLVANRQEQLLKVEKEIRELKLAIETFKYRNKLK